MVDYDGNINCKGCKECYHSVRCHNCAYCLYCSDLVLEKFMIFNQKINTEEDYFNILSIIKKKFGDLKPPKDLTAEDILWLTTNVEQFTSDSINDLIIKGL